MKHRYRGLPKNQVVSNEVHDLGISDLPWTMGKGLVRDGVDMEFEVTAANGAVVASFDCRDEQFNIEEGYANASLIAAAPELYDALERIFLRVDGRTIHFAGSAPWLERARKALEKAGAWAEHFRKTKGGLSK